MNSPKRKEQLNDASRRWRKKNPEKLKAINRRGYRKLNIEPRHSVRPQRGVTVWYPDGCEDHYTKKDFHHWLYDVHPCPFPRGTRYRIGNDEFKIGY